MEEDKKCLYYKAFLKESCWGEVVKTPAKDENGSTLCQGHINHIYKSRTTTNYGQHIQTIHMLQWYALYLL